MVNPAKCVGDESLAHTTVCTIDLGVPPARTVPPRDGRRHEKGARNEETADKAVSSALRVSSTVSTSQTKYGLIDQRETRTNTHKQTWCIVCRSVESKRPECWTPRTKNIEQRQSYSSSIKRISTPYPPMAQRHVQQPRPLRFLSVVPAFRSPRPVASPKIR